MYETIIIGGGAAADAFLAAVESAGLEKEIFPTCCWLSPPNGSTMGHANPAAYSNSPHQDFFTGLRFPDVYHRMAAACPGKGYFPLHYLGDFFSERRQWFIEQIREHGGEVAELPMEYVHSSFDTFHVGVGCNVIYGKRVVLAVGGLPKLLPPAMTMAPTVNAHEIIFPTNTFHELQSRLIVPGSKIEIRGRGSSAALALRLLALDSVETRYRFHNFKPYFDSVDEATSYGYEPEPVEVCPKTGKVNRYFGIRHEDRNHYFALHEGPDNRGNDFGFEGKPDLMVVASGYNHPPVMSNLNLFCTQGLLRSTANGRLLLPSGQASGRKVYTYGLGVWADRHPDDGGEGLPGAIRAYNIFNQRALRALQDW